MSEFAFFALLSVTILVGGVAWAVRGVMLRRQERIDAHEPVVIASGTELDVEVMRSKLNALGIKAFTRNRYGRILSGGVPLQLMGWEVLVRYRDVFEARTILGLAQEDAADVNQQS